MDKIKQSYYFPYLSVGTSQTWQKQWEYHHPQNKNKDKMKKIRHQNEDTAKTKEIKLNQVILVNVKHLIGLIVQMEIFLPLIFDILFLSLFFFILLHYYVILCIYYIICCWIIVVFISNIKYIIL